MRRTTAEQETTRKTRNRGANKPDPDVTGTLSIAEACEKLGIGTSTGYYLVARGEPWGVPGHFPVRVVTIGQTRKILKADMTQYLAGQAAAAG